MRIAAAVIVFALVACSTAAQPSVTPLPSPTQIVRPALTPAPSHAPSPTRVGPSVALGPVDAKGVPTSLDGAPVLRGPALRTTITASSDTTPFLIGGWFRPPIVTRYCPAFTLDHAVDSCYTFYLFDWRIGPDRVAVAPGDVPKAASIAGTVERPAILRVHTHDPRCEEHEDCVHRAILDEIAWLGDEPLESAPPRVVDTPPPGGIAREEAIQRARAESYPHSTPLKVVSARAVPLWTVLPQEELAYGDIWLWVVVLEGRFTSPCDDCQGADREEVFLEYLDGDFLMARL